MDEIVEACALESHVHARSDGALKYAKLQAHNWRTAEPTIWFDKVRSRGHLRSALRRHTALTAPHVPARSRLA